MAGPTRYHWLKLRAVAHPSEVVDRVAAATRYAATGDATAVVEMTDTLLETHHGLQQHLLEVTVEKSRAIRDLLDRVFALPGARERLQATLDARMDEDGVLYWRVDKQAAFAGNLQLTEGEDCIQFRLKVEAYPSGREASLAAVVELLARDKA